MSAALKTLTFVPQWQADAEERAAKRKALIAEARAWRDGAELLHDYRGRFPSLATVAAYSGGLNAQMRGRYIPHYEKLDATDGDFPAPWDADGHSARVLACLFLALEAEDEARELTPPRAPTAKRRSRSVPSRQASQKKQKKSNAKVTR